MPPQAELTNRVFAAANPTTASASRSAAQAGEWSSMPINAVSKLAARAVALLADRGIASAPTMSSQDMPRPAIPMLSIETTNRSLSNPEAAGGQATQALPTTAVSGAGDSDMGAGVGGPELVAPLRATERLRISHFNRRTSVPNALGVPSYTALNIGSESTVLARDESSASVMRSPLTSGDSLLSLRPRERPHGSQRVFKTQKEAALAMEANSMVKAGLRLDQLILLGLMAGMFAAFAGLFALSITGAMPEGDAGLRKLLFGASFQMVLVFTVLFNADLFLGLNVFMTIGALTRAIKWKDWLRVVGLAYCTNFVGAVCGAAFFGYLTDFFDAPHYRVALEALTMSKVTMSPGAAFLRGIGSNWLTGLGIFMASSAETVEGKILSIFLSVTLSATTGFEHSVGNMFFVTLGLMYGAPTTFGTFIYRNLILVTLGNLVGGTVFMAAVIWWVYLDGRRTPPALPFVSNGK